MIVQFNGNSDELSFNSYEQRVGEIPSAGIHASARGLAKLAAAMANKGTLKGK